MANQARGGCPIIIFYVTKFGQVNGLIFGEQAHADKLGTDMGRAWQGCTSSSVTALPQIDGIFWIFQYLEIFREFENI